MTTTAKIKNVIVCLDSRICSCGRSMIDPHFKGDASRGDASVGSASADGFFNEECVLGAIIDRY